MNSIALQEKNAAVNVVGGCTVSNYEAVTAEEFAAALEELLGAGYSKYEEREIDSWHYVALRQGENALFLNYFSQLKELNAVEEPDSKYFSFSSPAKEACCQPQITQVLVNDFGMSYAIRLSDGRFIIIDGGWEKEFDANSLLSVLKKYSPLEKPVIAAWIQSHPHIDHYRCFILFMSLYGDEVTVEKMLFHFPDADDLEHYPKLCNIKPTKPDFEQTESGTIPRMLRVIEERNIPVFTPHSGQIYRIGDAVLHFLGGMDDTVHRTQNVNMTSLFFRMELGGQVVLWTCDGGFSEVRLTEKIPQYLKSDILQVPHHGFQCGTAEAEIRAYRCIRPSLCLIPVEPGVAFSQLCTYRDGTRYLMTDADVDEILLGDQEHTVALPYTADRSGKAEFLRKFRRGRESAGAYAWVFSELNTAVDSDFEFTVSNFTKIKAEISVTMIFAERTDRNVGFALECPKDSLMRFSLKDPETLKKVSAKPIPEGALFSIRFRSNVPVVISHPNHTAAYHSEFAE